MKKLLTIAATLSLLMIPFAVYSADSGSQGSKIPPVSQPLVAEGDFALQLATALKLGKPTTEAHAEDMLASVGITPKNGWIADYPMTPIVVGEVQNAMVASIDSKKLSMGKEEALRVFRTAILQAGIPIVADLSGKYPETQPQYVESSAVDDYYSSEGPPVVTYYPPPPDYGYLYAWVPYPFFWTGFFFPGFFVLNDFDIVVVNDHFGYHFHHDHDFDHHGHDFDHRITNHFRDPATHELRRVDPTMRTAGMYINTSRMAAFRSPGFRGMTGRNFGGTMPRSSTGGAGNFTRPSPNFARSFSAPSRGGGGFSGGFHGGGGGFRR